MLLFFSEYSKALLKCYNLRKLSKFQRQGQQLKQRNLRKGNTTPQSICFSLTEMNFAVCEHCRTCIDCSLFYFLFCIMDFIFKYCVISDFTYTSLLFIYFYFASVVVTTEVDKC